MRQFNLVRLALFQMGFGIMLGFLHVTLNRVMTSDLGISSTIVFGLISLKELLAVLGIKVWAGNMSDKAHVFGYKRSPYILLGLVSCVASFMMMPGVAYEVQIAGVELARLLPAMITDVALFKLVIIFIVFGFGLQVATTAYYALLADYVGDKTLGKVTSASWALMVMSTIIFAYTVGNYLEVFTPERLGNVAFVGGLIALGIGLFAFLGVEERHASGDAAEKEEALSFGQSLKLLSISPKTLLFAFYIFTSIYGIFAYEIVMEPFGADVFDMPVSVTNKLFEPTIKGMMLIFMLGVGFFLHRIGKKRGALVGNLFAITGFSVVIVSGFMTDESLLRTGLVIAGIGLGSSSISNITMMMTMTAGRSGIYIGLWGTAQSLAIFLAHSGAGVLRDLVLFFTGNYMWAYAGIFSLEIMALIIATALLPRVSQKEFEEESRVKVAEVLGNVVER
ncbi:BCD family MFS transporter [Prosthecochloris sp. N3]|uniref:BCD family MFS transporter n=1 Tax=Prosthecochloris ethylica TaxID=2743976 RepID=A0ABR9XTB0_9CHLB|nr:MULTISPECIES: BCD family MFS transporter [Prosthecochloris]MEC9487253.1 BCD family MFS transporter [Prosthecochloris sp.]MBF0585565.1 BCD family MFS transporter [Prosthecochloris ethylica]MBF0637142.1 BCD family MFS transporter [Prosthecochloris ethylica]NUK46795.1 BCD family MFS transporter [Prosthecochloris ethylica]RNA64627.1 MFS transporter [Prosthecochloris sp. ZM_2]